VERVVSVKANYFANFYGYDVTIIVTEGKGKPSFFPLSDRVKVINLGLDFEELWHQPFYMKVFLYIKKQRLFKKFLTSELMWIHPDITISVLRREINFITKIKDGSKKIGELHVNRRNYRNIKDVGSNVFKRLFVKFWARNLLTHLRQLETMVVLTDNALDDWPELNNVIKIPDPLPFRLDAKSFLSQKRVISIGRYEFDKGNDLLLCVWAEVEKQMPEWHLDIYGDGFREPFQRLMGQLGIDTSHCHLFGPTSDVKQEYLNSSVFVLPSRFEGFGLVLIEAMACGVPVVSFDCENGPRSIITDGVDGFLISPFDVEAFAEKVIMLMKDEELRREMGENARRSAEKYDIDKVGPQWKQLFDELMENR
jgi:glycosyltransferase involved in cell wall biosynthesis